LTKRACGFTLIEMLVVISIIVILIGILVPVIGKVRQQAMATDTHARIQSLSAAIQAYYGDFHAYPGPVPNAQLRVAGPGSSNPSGCGIVSAKDTTGAAIATFDPTAMSMAENLYLGLNGGLEPDTANPGQFIFNAQKMGTGARALGPTPKKYTAYSDNTGVTKDSMGMGKFVDDDGNAAADTVIPEYLDTFASPMPLLYLRATVQAPGVASTANHKTAPGDPPIQQYDVQQVLSYTDTGIGVGRSANQSDYSPAFDPAHPHGLRSVNPAACIGTVSGYTTTYPYDLYAALIDPTIQRDATASATAPGKNTPRQKDGYILISAGIDRVYGTEDDITSFGKW
jgi:prepilin-type N-terminal cleavage/methylation domain-containing protein